MKYSGFSLQKKTTKLLIKSVKHSVQYAHFSFTKFFFCVFNNPITFKYSSNLRQNTLLVTHKKRFFKIDSVQ